MKTKSNSSGVFWVNGVQKLGQQLALSFAFGKRLAKSIKKGFVWIRPDGKKIPCATPKALCKAIMDYDGVWLKRLVAQANKMLATR